MFSLLPLTAISAAGFAYRYLADSFRMISYEQEIKNTSLVSELAFLRSQISPHFIFNVINSIVSLSRLNPQYVEPALIQLSGLMRYMLYVSDEQKVTLGNKMDYLRSYIELQKMRFQDGINVNMTFNISHPEKTIEPMLLIPFVENAFKHGAFEAADATVNILLRADDKTLFFSVENSFDATEKEKDENHGIGLANVKRRLELLYPGQIDLIFCDIQMPGLNGLQLVKSLVNKPMVIFITAYEKFAIDGFDLDVIDYLVKPVPLERFLRACQKAHQLFEMNEYSKEKHLPVRKHLFVHSEYNLIKINIADIEHIEGLKDYVKIFLINQPKPVISRTSIKSLELQLPAELFFRIHKSYLINIDHVMQIRRGKISLVRLHFAPGYLIYFFSGLIDPNLAA
eukprot:gene7138-7206_t